MNTQQEPVNCPECQPLLTEIIRCGTPIRFHKGLADLDAGRLRGCEICHLQCMLMTLMIPAERDLMNAKKPNDTCVIILNGPNSHWSMDWRYADMITQPVEPWFFHPFGNPPGPRMGLAPARSSAHSRPIYQDVDSRWATVQQWLTLCDEKHERCRVLRKRRTGKLPRRLVQTGISGKVRLRLSEDLQPDTKFCTLSHCWGTHVPLKLLKTNIDHLRHEIVVIELSKTFREALYTARMLGMEFIWIDSLW